MNQKNQKKKTQTADHEVQTSTLTKNDKEPANLQQRVIRLLKYAGKRYFIDALSAMALGLFSSLIIGLILRQLFSLINASFVDEMEALIVSITAANSPVIGAAIGVAIAAGLKNKPLVVYSSAAAGAIGYAVSSDGIAAGPVGAYIAVIIGAELGRLIAGKTRLDILLVPAVTILSGTAAGMIVGPSIARMMIAIGQAVNEMTQLRPLPMGIAVSAVMGFILTMPISSAAIAIMLGLSGWAAGAATAGCAAHMVGFAVASFRENKVGGLLAQGLGTSMLQVGNIIRRPYILIPAVAASMITGALSTTVFRMENLAAGAGMGTSGLVGSLTTWTAMSEILPSGQLFTYILLLHFFLPAVIALAVSELLRKVGWIRFGDMRLDL